MKTLISLFVFLGALAAVPLTSEAITCQWFAVERYRCPAPDGLVYNPQQADAQFGAGAWIVVGAPAPPPVSPPPPPGGGACAPIGELVATKVAALGDSITASGYITALRFFRRGVNFYDLGAPGARVYNLLPAIPQALATGAQAIIFNGGINDLAEGRAVNAILSDIQAAGQAVTAAGRAFYLAGLTPPNGDPLISVATAKALNAGMHALAAANCWRFAPLWQRLADPAHDGYFQSRYDNGDGVHPSDEGDLVIAEQIARFAWW